MSLLHGVQKIKNSTNLEEVNNLLSEGWVLLEITKQYNHHSYMLGLLAPKARRRIHLFTKVCVTGFNLADFEDQLKSLLLSDLKTKLNRAG